VLARDKISGETVELNSKHSFMIMCYFSNTFLFYFLVAKDQVERKPVARRLTATNFDTEFGNHNQNNCFFLTFTILYLLLVGEDQSSDDADDDALKYDFSGFTYEPEATIESSYGTFVLFI
jgi:hypothetical protein